MDEREIADIIERVQRRLATADSAHPGIGMQAGAEVAAAAEVQLGDGIHAIAEKLPKSIRIRGLREATTQTDDRDRLFLER